MKALGKAGLTKTLAKEAVEVAAGQGRFTIFAVVDALTRIARELPNAGDRTDADQKAASLLAMVGQRPSGRGTVNGITVRLHPSRQAFWKSPGVPRVARTRMTRTADRSFAAGRKISKHSQTMLLTWEFW